MSLDSSLKAFKELMWFLVFLVSNNVLSVQLVLFIFYRLLKRSANCCYFANEIANISKYKYILAVLHTLYLVQYRILKLKLKKVYP